MTWPVATQVLDDSGIGPSLAHAAWLARRLAGAEAAVARLTGHRGASRVDDPMDLLSEPALDALAAGEALWIEDDAAAQRLWPGVRGCAVQPILVGAVVIGHLAIACRGPLAFDADAEAILAKLAQGVAEAWVRQVDLERVSRSERRLQHAVKLAELHVWEIDYRTGEISSDDSREIFFDTPPDPVAFMRDPNITIDPRDREGLVEPWRIAVDHDLPFTAEYRINRADGKEVWAACSVKLVRDGDGQPIRLIGAMQNVTERRNAEASLVQARDDADTANRAKSRFLATMSHEIRTPLNGVLGMAQVMAADELIPRQRDRLDVIRQSGETLMAILNDVLDLAKIEAGKLELEIAEFDVAELVRGAHAAFDAVAAKKGVAFRLDIDAGALGRLRGDSTRVRQVLYNLVSNALKFTDQGEVHVGVAPTPVGLSITVRDTGIGIAANRLETLFQRFEQADTSTTRRYGGTGLGLAICRELVALMGGEIRAQSVLQQGTTFTITLPLERVRRADPARAHLVAFEAAEASHASPSLRVLAAEDNAVNQLVLKTLLQQVGLEPTIVDNGRACVEAWQDAPWDLILMDVQMPEMDGIAATRAIREQECLGGRARTPIVALTADAMAHQAVQYRAAGMDGLVAKPIDAARLFQTLQDLLAQPEADAA